MDALDFLLKSQPQDGPKVRSGPPSTTRSGPPPSTTSAAVQTALHAATAGQVLSTCSEIEQERSGSQPGAFLSEIDSRLRIGAELLIPVVRLLATAGLLEVSEERPFNDDRVTVTDQGRQLLVPGQQVELFRRLGLVV